jgi:hypothetical protein
MTQGSSKLCSAVLLFTFAFHLHSGVAVAQSARAAEPAAAVRTEKFYRTELYFGRSIPGGGIVSDQEWNSFLADIVTPRFPDGFTSLKAIGQYREKGGKIVTEPSEVLIFFYSGRNKNESRAKIEQIRAAYLKMFKQESVLRVDLPKSVRVSF